jgi:NAD(P)H dehydrogenase (quinone)
MSTKPLKHAIILAHPDPESFNAAVAKAYAKAVKGMGHKAVVRDLYALKFDPCLPLTELPWREDYRAAADLVAEREAVADADVFVFVYPLWFNGPPAILKGWVDRVMSMGFGFSPGPGGTAPSLAGRRLMTFSSSGAPDHWVRGTGAMEHLRKGFDEHLAGVTGMTVAGHSHFGAITPGIRPDAVKDLLRDVAEQARALFGHGAIA